MHFLAKALTNGGKCRILSIVKLYRIDTLQGYLGKGKGGQGVICERFKMLGNVCGEYVDDARRKL